jgi:hypothetical protein
MVRSAAVLARWFLPAAALCACGDSTGLRNDIPDLSGTYQLHEAVTAVTCTPQRPPPGGTVIFEAFSVDFPVRIQQAGSRLTIIDLEFPDDPPMTGTIDAQGRAQLTLDISYREDPREGNRIFFNNLSMRQTVSQGGPGVLRGTGSYTNEFHEGSLTAPVFAVCSRTVTVEYTRTGS